MERRLVLVGLAAFAATPALAQSDPVPANPAPVTDAPAAPAPAPSTPASAPAMKQATPLTMSDASKTHMERTMAAGSLSLLTSRDAAKKVKEAMLKQFVTFETAEQETIASILKARMMPGAPPSGEVVPPTDAELEGNLDAKGKADFAKLQAEKAGAAFERAYVKAQIATHKELLDIQETYLKVADDLDETNVAKLAKGQIVEHLTLLGDIERQLG